jgi:dihydrofolate reductase
LTQTPVCLVVAAAENRVIGSNGQLPWNIPNDLKRFKALTLGKPCLMGRKTWESLPRKPLAGRTNIVVSRNAAFRAEGAQLAISFEQAIEIAEWTNPGEIAVIGGEKLFESALPRASRIYLTEVSGTPRGDTFLPVIGREEWHEIERDGPHRAGALSWSFVTLERITCG